MYELDVEIIHSLNHAGPHPSCPTIDRILPVSSCGPQEGYGSDMPDANKSTAGIMALVAPQEREAISTRTKAALAAANARGTKLGGYRGVPPPPAAKASAGRIAKADLFAFRVGPLVRELQASGMMLDAIARELAVRGIRTARGGTWACQTVKNLLARGMG